jgi:hypothetical protein
MEEHFPKIARIGSKSFFGIPPPPVAPELATENNATPPAPRLNSMANPARQPPPERQVFVADSSPLRLLAGDNGDQEDSEDEDAPVHTPTGNRSVNAYTPHRRSHTRPNHRRQESRNTDAVDPMAWTQDEKAGLTWHEQELADTFSRLIPIRRTRCLVWKPSVIYCTIQSLEKY